MKTASVGAHANKERPVPRPPQGLQFMVNHCEDRGGGAFGLVQLFMAQPKFVPPQCYMCVLLRCLKLTFNIPAVVEYRFGHFANCYSNNPYGM